MKASERSLTALANKEGPYLPPEILHNILLYLSNIQLCRSVKRVSCLYRSVAEGVRPDKLPPLLWEQVFLYLEKTELQIDVAAVSSTFHHIINNPRTPSLQRLVWRTRTATPLPEPEHPDIELELNPSFDVEMPYRNLHIPFEKIRGTERGNPWHTEEYMDDDACYPAINSAILKCAFLETEVTAPPGRGLTVKDITKGFVELFQRSEGRDLIVQFIKESACHKLPKDKTSWSFVARAAQWGSYDINRIDIVDVDECNVAWISHMTQCWWDWESLGASIVNGETVFELTQWLHVNCGVGCAGYLGGTTWLEDHEVGQWKEAHAAAVEPYHG